MEIHLHLAATYPSEPWVEHFEWLNPLFNERIEIETADVAPTGQAWAFSQRADARLTVETADFGQQ